MRTWTDFKKTMRAEDVIFSLARSGDLDSLRELELDAGRIDEKNEKGYSPLMLAAYNGNLEIARFLLSNGADSNTADPAGSTVLMGAAFKGDLAMVRMLIAAGARADARNDKGQTALDFANMFGRADVARFLKSQQEKPEVFGLADILSGWSSYLFPQRRS
ncbi:MAG TPA: ankyrin repeat domain-containing protein [Thermoanaerobaculia bacterium]|nr:ankyrin repeat domain-containing protein [Thermoanaerobaculia bacterium]